jgi:uncharacterized protein (DUF1778 family)
MAAKKKKTDGKPVKTRPGTKSEMLRIRITVEQRQLLQQAADLEALDLGTWLRQLGIKTARALLSTDK